MGPIYFYKFKFGESNIPMVTVTTHDAQKPFLDPLYGSYFPLWANPAKIWKLITFS